MREGVERLVRLARSRSHLLDGSSFGVWLAVVELEELEAHRRERFRESLARVARDHAGTFERLAAEEARER